MSKALKTIQKVLAAPEELRDGLKDKTNAELSAHYALAQNQNELQELAYEIIQWAWADAMAQDIVPLVLETKTVGLDEIDYMEEDLRGLRAYWQGKGGKILSGILRHSREQMPREEMVAALDLHQDEVATNFWGTLTKLQSQYTEQLAQLPTKRLIELIARALPHPSTIDTEALTASVAAGSLADTDVDPIMRTVMKQSKGNVSFLGTRHALFNLADIGLTYGDNVREQLFQTGQIGAYKGAPVVQVENFEDFYGDDVLPDNEIWIIGRNAGRLTYYGNTAKAQVLRMEAFYWRWETARDAGMSLFGAEDGRIGRIILT